MPCLRCWSRPQLFRYRRRSKYHRNSCLRYSKFRRNSCLQYSRYRRNSCRQCSNFRRNSCHRLRWRRGFHRLPCCLLCDSRHRCPMLQRCLLCRPQRMFLLKWRFHQCWTYLPNWRRRLFLRCFPQLPLSCHPSRMLQLRPLRHRYRPLLCCLHHRHHRIPLGKPVLGVTPGSFAFSSPNPLPPPTNRVAPQVQLQPVCEAKRTSSGRIPRVSSA